MLNDIVQICNGYLCTPYQDVRQLIYANDLHDDHACGWPEYSMWGSEIYPPVLNQLADAGIPFIWEFVLTEDFSYFAYNFPTDEQANCLVSYKTGKRKRAPRVTKKMRKELETLNAANTLLLQLGHKHGSSKT